MSFRGPQDRLHLPQYRESACYYGRDERCVLCWLRLFWVIIRPGPWSHRVALLWTLFAALVVGVTVAVLWGVV